MENFQRDIAAFVARSPTGLLQLLIAAANQRTLQRIINCPAYPVAEESPGLDEAVGKLCRFLARPETAVAEFLAILYFSTQTLDSRKRSGQFFTSGAVSEWALSLAAARIGDVILDAGAGTAVFAEALIRKGYRVSSYLGVESDKTLALCSAHTLESIGADSHYKILYSNFLLLDESKLTALGLAAPNYIISNPPFVRFHNLKGRDKIRTAIKTNTGILLSPYAGSGSYFLARAAELADTSRVRSNRDRRLVFFFPREAAGSAHAQQLRNDLRERHGWTYSHYEVPVKHPGMDKHPSNAVGSLYVFVQGSSARSKSPRASLARQLTLGDLVKIRRGLSTGFNEFFVLTDGELMMRGIPLKRVQKVLPTRVSLPGPDFSEDEWNAHRLAGRPCWVLALPPTPIDEFETQLRLYLEEGIRHGVHQTPTARHMRYWYSLPIPNTPPDLFITYMFRGSPRFILNLAKVHNLTNILSGRFCRDLSDDDRSTVVQVLNAEARRWTNNSFPGREYKRGLRKIEPGELSRLPLDTELYPFLPQGAENNIDPSLF